MPLDDAPSDALTQVVAEAARLRSAAQAVLLGATAALEAARAGSGRTALREVARASTRAAKRTAEVSEQVAEMPNVARGLAAGALTPEHVEVLADTARQTSPKAVDTAAELLEAAAAVPPEVLRRDARSFVARHDPDAVRTALDRQRRDRSAALFIDHSTGMGVLNAKFDPVSFALLRQAVENYNDALWRLDGGRDGTPDAVRDNCQRLADSIFEMLTDRNALATIQHPTAGTGDAAHCGQDDAGHDQRAGAKRGRERDRDRDTEHDEPNHHSDQARTGKQDRAHHNPEHDEADHTNRAVLHQSGSAANNHLASRSVDRWRPAQAPNQLVIIADIGVIDGTKPDGLCEALGVGPVPPNILDDLSPDTRITGALFGGAGQVLHLGRSRRQASVAQQLAIAIRDRGCVLCRAPMHRCKYHHIDEWRADNGATDIDNLAALCGKCHSDLHNNNRRLHQHPATGRWTTTPRTHTGSRGTSTTGTGARSRSTGSSTSTSTGSHTSNDTHTSRGTRSMDAAVKASAIDSTRRASPPFRQRE